MFVNAVETPVIRAVFHIAVKQYFGRRLVESVIRYRKTSVVGSAGVAVDSESTENRSESNHVA